MVVIALPSVAKVQPERNREEMDRTIARKFIRPFHRIEKSILRFWSGPPKLPLARRARLTLAQQSFASGTLAREV